MRTAQWEEDMLFPKASETEIARTKFLLGKYKSMRMLMDDYETYTQDMQQVAIDGEMARRIDEDELYADKVANAAILAEKQRWVYEQYRFCTLMLQRAYGLIQDSEASRAIKYRYMDGHGSKETLLYFQSSMSESTIKRKLKEGERSMAKMLKLWGFFQKDAIKF